MLYDLIIRGGTVYDGTGAPGVRADVAVRDGKIAAIGDLTQDRGARELDAGGGSGLHRRPLPLRPQLCPG